MFCAVGNILAVVKPIFHRLFRIIIVDIVLSSEAKLEKVQVYLIEILDYSVIIVYNSPSKGTE